MKHFIGTIIFGISIIFGVVVGSLAVIGVVYEILGPVTFEELTAWLNIPWSMGLYAKAAFISLAILMTSLFIYNKYFWE